MTASDKPDNLEWHERTNCNVTQSQLEIDIASLNTNQRALLNVVINHFNNINMVTPLRFLCTGGAGTGKSFSYSKLLCTGSNYVHQNVSANPVIVAAPTGVAAHNIQGFTSHSIFKLPIQHGYQPQFYELSHSLLKTLREKFANVHTIIIDEISMMFRNNLYTSDCVVLQIIMNHLVATT